MLLTIAACLGLAAISLLLPSEPSYDPWAWFVPFGDELPVALWVVVARAGALLALVLAFRLAARLTGGSWVLRAVAGAIAVAALVSTPDWFQFTAHASEAPLAVALMLWAILRHLDGVREQVMVLGTLACLLRPEHFPFFAL
jgi:hypothetical protein